MTVLAIGYTIGDPAVSSLNPFSLGGSPVVADGDWVFWFAYYPNTATLTFAAPSGWTQLRKTIGTVGTIELWRRHWATGDPTTWTINRTGSGTDRAFTIVFRGVLSTPTLLSTTHETFTAPVLVDTITDAAIGDNDLAVSFSAAAPTGSPRPGVDPGGTEENLHILGSGGPGMAAGMWRVGAGSAPSRSIGVFGGSPTDMFGLQLVLDDAPVGGWGVGQVRMGAN